MAGLRDGGCKPTLDRTIEDTIRESWLPNTVAWVATVAGAFLVNLDLLVLVTGRV